MFCISREAESCILAFAKFRFLRGFRSSYCSYPGPRAGARAYGGNGNGCSIRWGRRALRGFAHRSLQAGGCVESGFAAEVFEDARLGRGQVESGFAVERR